MVNKILIFAHDSSMYGATLSLLSLLENMCQDENYKILVLLPYGGEIEKHLNRLSIDYQIIPFQRCVTTNEQNLKLKIINIVKYIRNENRILSRLLEVAKKFKPDVIYTNTSVVSIGYTLAKKIKVPHVWHIREYGDLDYAFQYLPTRKTVIKKIVDTEIALFVSKELKKHWVVSNDDKFKVVYNGFKKFDLEKKRVGEITEKFRFGLLGAITRGKGQDIAIRGFLQFMKEKNQGELHFYGSILDQKYYSELNQIIEQSLYKEKIHFHQFNPDIESIYKNVDVLLSCSKHEGFGRTIVEAMLRGIPVIANESGGPIEIIDNGVNGLLYKQTFESLTESMMLLTSNPFTYREISINASEKAEKIFSLDLYVNQLKKVLQMKTKS